MIVLEIKSILAGLFLIIILGFSMNASAQTSNLILLDDRNHYGQFSIDNVRVAQKDYYKVIFMDVHIKVKDLALEDFANVYWDSITLTNENGKTYKPEGNEGPDCKKEWNGSFYENPGVKGSDGGIGQHSLCYMVEKEFNNFKVYYTIPFYGMNLHSYQIGNIDLNQNPFTNPITDIKNINMTKPVDFFSQLIEWFKNLFKFS